MAITETEATIADGEVALMLPDAGRILKHTTESDGAGGKIETYVPGEELPCRIAPVGRTAGRGSGAGDRISEASTHIATFPAGTEVRAVDRVEVAGTVYSVTGLRQYGALEFTRRVECKEL